MSLLDSSNNSTTTNTAILSPANKGWMYLSIFLSWLINITPFSAPQWAPDFLALTLVFWSVREPRMFGMLTAFVFGLFMDVFDGTVLGQHSLAYVLLCYGAIAMHRRIPWFTPVGQILHILPLFLGMQAIVLFIRLWLGGVFPGWLWFSESFVNALLWPVWSLLLLIPQHSRNKSDVSSL